MPSPATAIVISPNRIGTKFAGSCPGRPRPTRSQRHSLETLPFTTSRPGGTLFHNVTGRRRSVSQRHGHKAPSVHNVTAGSRPLSQRHGGEASRSPRPLGRRIARLGGAPPSPRRRTGPCPRDPPGPSPSHLGQPPDDKDRALAKASASRNRGLPPALAFPAEVHRGNRRHKPSKSMTSPPFRVSMARTFSTGVE